jgi:hypothetical protein
MGHSSDGRAFTDLLLRLRTSVNPNSTLAWLRIRKQLRCHHPWIIITRDTFAQLVGAFKILR